MFFVKVIIQKIVQPRSETPTPKLVTYKTCKKEQKKTRLNETISLSHITSY
jgi:hypothetical protein